MQAFDEVLLRIGAEVIESIELVRRFKKKRTGEISLECRTSNLVELLHYCVALVEAAVAVANEVDVVGANARLQRSMLAAIRLTETAFETLHSTANEKRRVVMLGDDRPIDDERKAEILESAADGI